MKVIWSEQALHDVEHIRDYIAQDAPAYAQSFVERLLQATRHLPQFPHSGRSLPEAHSPDIRECDLPGLSHRLPAAFRYRRDRDGCPR